MDHSVQGYLQRRTTEELRNILNGYYGKTLLPVEEDIVEMILEILQNRLQNSDRTRLPVCPKDKQ